MFMKQLSDVFLTAAEEAGICLIRDESSGCVKKDRKPSKPWFDKESRIRRTEYQRTRGRLYTVGERRRELCLIESKR